MIDLGTGNNNKINWAMSEKQEFIDIVETVYRGARKGRGLVIAPKGMDWGVEYVPAVCTCHIGDALGDAHNPCIVLHRLLDQVPILGVCHYCLEIQNIVCMYAPQMKLDRCKTAYE